jgi:hypothetical protein
MCNNAFSIKENKKLGCYKYMEMKEKGKECDGESVTYMCRPN